MQETELTSHHNRDFPDVYIRIHRWIPILYLLAILNSVLLDLHLQVYIGLIGEIPQPRHIGSDFVHGVPKIIGLDKSGLMVDFQIPEFNLMPRYNHFIALVLVLGVDGNASGFITDLINNGLGGGLQEMIE